MPKDDDIESFCPPLPPIRFHQLHRKTALVFEVRASQPFLDSVDKAPRDPLRDEAERETGESVLRQLPPEAVRKVAIVDHVAVHDQILSLAGVEGVLQSDIGHSFFHERAVEKKIAVSLDVVNGHPFVAQ